MHGRLRILRLAPEPKLRRAALEHFARNQHYSGYAYFASFSDRIVRTVKESFEHPSVGNVTATELVQSAFAVCGGRSLRLATGADLRAQVARCCQTALADSFFERSAQFPGAHRALELTTGELLDYGYTPASLRASMPSASPELAEKLLALADLIEQVDRGLSGCQLERFSSLLSRCLQLPPQPQPFDRLFLMAAAQRKPLLEGFLRWLVECGVSITLAIDRLGSDGSLFCDGWELENSLGWRARGYPNSPRWYSRIFDGIAGRGVPNVNLRAAPDALSECEWALRDAAMLLERGTMPAQIAIFARDPATYGPLLQAAGLRLGVPVDVHMLAPLLSNSYARLTLSTLKACAGRDVRALRPIATSSYVGLPPDLRRASMDAIAGAHASRSGEWQKLSEIADDLELTWLQELLAWRSMLEGLDTLDEWYEALVNLFGLGVFEHALSGPGGDENRMAQSAMSRALLAYQRAQGKSAGRPDLADFASLCEQLWRPEEYVSSRTSGGIRMVADVEDLGEADAVVALGMLEGSFPRRASEDSVLSDVERRELGALNRQLVPLPTSDAVALKERDDFIRLCAAAPDALYCSYPLGEGDRHNVPAYYVSLLEGATGAKRQELPRALIVPLAADCFLEPDKALRSALDGPRSPTRSVMFGSPRVRSMVRQRAGGTPSTSAVAAALQCGFRAAFRHALHVEPRDNARPAAAFDRRAAMARLPAKVDESSVLEALTAAATSLSDELYVSLQPWENALLVEYIKRQIPELVRSEMNSRDKFPGRSETLEALEAFTVKAFDRHLRLRANSGGRLQDKPVLYLDTDDLAKLTDRFLLDWLRDPTVEVSADMVLSSSRSLAQVAAAILFLGSQEHRSFALELLSGEGGRALLTFGQSAWLKPKGLTQPREAWSDGQGLVLRHIVPTKSLVLRYRQLLKAGADALEEARGKAVPGDWCKSCSLGELCRTSSQLTMLVETIGEPV